MVQVTSLLVVVLHTDSMAPAHVYSHLSASSDVESDLQSEKIEFDNHMPPKSTIKAKFLYASTFLSGILVGIALSALEPLAWSKAPAIERVNIVDTETFRNGTHVIVNIDGVEVEGTQCGDTWEDAKRLGCHYDVMTSRWYSTECFDEEVLVDFLAEPLVNYTWYADRNHTQQVPEQVALSGEFDKLFPLYDYHIAHCLYLWRRLHHAVVTTRPLDDDLLSYEHTIHCTRMILAWRSPYEKMTLTIAHTGLPFCRERPLGILGA